MKKREKEYQEDYPKDRDGGYCDGSENEDNELPALLDLNFLRGLVNGEIDCSGLLGVVTFIVPRGTRSKSVFCRRFQPTNYTQNYGISRLLRTGEAASSSVNQEFIFPDRCYWFPETGSDAWCMSYVVSVLQLVPIC
ncbi:hypothetical protein J6590_098564 [Homalodisca vitripennis]|nr:hypothetical protein J6590_098564 [Homalodisca vitripennis]